MSHVAIDFARTGKMLKELNHTFIALITKTEEPRHLKDFKPINLCNKIYRILSKAILNHIMPPSNRFVGPYYNGFAHGK